MTRKEEKVGVLWVWRERKRVGGRGKKKGIIDKEGQGKELL